MINEQERVDACLEARGGGVDKGRGSAEAGLIRGGASGGVGGLNAGGGAS